MSWGDVVQSILLDSPVPVGVEPRLDSMRDIRHRSADSRSMMTLDRDDIATADPAGGDELDRLRLALLHERSRAERAEDELAALRAQQPEQVEPAPRRSTRRGWRR